LAQNAAFLGDDIEQVNERWTTKLRLKIFRQLLLLLLLQ